MRAQIRGIEMASKNSQDAISLVQTAEGALTETQSILQRMRELSVQSASDTNEDIDRDALQAEFEQLKAEIDDISDQTKFNNMQLLTGTFGSKIDTATGAGHSTLFTVAGVTDVKANGAAGTSYTFADDGTDLTITRTVGADTTVVTMASPVSGEGSISVADFGLEVTLGPGYVTGSLDGDIVMAAGSGSLSIQTGASQGETLDVTIDAMDADSLGLDATVKIDTLADAENAITTVDQALRDVSSQRASLGAIQNRLDHKINNLNTSAENLTAAESRIRDVDMAQEMVEFTKNNILLQAAQSMLAQANAQPQGVLQLLQ
jgi:flagellin